MMVMLESEAALAGLRTARAEFVERLLAGWSDADRRALGIALDRVRASLEAELEEA